MKNKTRTHTIQETLRREAGVRVWKEERSLAPDFYT